MGFHYGTCEVTLAVHEVGQGNFHDLGLDAREIVEDCVSHGTRYGGKMTIGEGTSEIVIGVSGVSLVRGTN